MSGCALFVDMQLVDVADLVGKRRAHRELALSHVDAVDYADDVRHGAVPREVGGRTA